MTLKNYLYVMGALTLVCWGVFSFVVSLIDPTTTNWLGFTLFYLALFIALSGTIALIGFFLRVVVWKKELVFNLVRVSFRQSFLLSLFMVILLILKSQNLFTWLNLSLLVIIFVIVELVSLSFKKTR